VPTYDGTKDPKVIESYRRKVAVWQRMATPYMPINEMGLRLWDALTGQAAALIHDEDTWDQFDHKDGVARLLGRVASHFATDDMVGL
jgi:hypothetical protein